jgi:hypothetical protein
MAAGAWVIMVYRWLYTRMNPVRWSAFQAYVHILAVSCSGTQQTRSGIVHVMAAALINKELTLLVPQQST